MADGKHTPGPWSVSGISQADGSISIAKDGIVIAYATNASSFGDFINAALSGRKDFGAPDTAFTQLANARLLAAAPELLAVAKKAESYLAYIAQHLEEHEFSGHAGNCTIIGKELRAAIAKAGAP